MKFETLLTLLNFSPENIIEKHPFWKKLYNKGIDIKQEKLKVKFKNNNEFEELKNNWRNDANIVENFYVFLRENFPNAIPSSLFFLCEVKSKDNEVLSLEDVNRYRLNNELEEFEFIRYFEDDEEDDDEEYEKEYEHVNADYKVESTIIYLADKWLKDILSGESFYNNNKQYFTKKEIKLFLTCDWLNPYKISYDSGYMDLLKYYWGTKIKANDLIGILTPEFCSYIFDDLSNEILHDYFYFICRNKKSVKNEYEIHNIWDSLKHMLGFDFDHVTWKQLKETSNEWHKQQIDSPGYDPKKQWKKTEIKDYIFKNGESLWTINEITTGKLLYEEGVDMHNCVFSYIEECIQGYCAIFSLKMRYERIATLEVRKYGLRYILVQVRGLLNEELKDAETKEIIKLWAKENNIIIELK